MTGWRQVAAAVLAVGVAVLLDAGPAQAARQVPITGAGSSWAGVAMASWVAQIKAASGLDVSYSPLGATSGRRQFAAGADFAVSEVPYGLTDEGTADPPPSRPFTYVPLVGGGTSFAYHLTIGGSRVTRLRLSGENLALVFTGVITNWSDARLGADNPGLALPDRPVVPVVRSDGSATTRQLTSWFSARYGSVWSAYCARTGRVACGPTSVYPTVPGMVAQAGSTGVAGYLQQASSEGTITYVEDAYAQGAGLPVADVLNRAGYYVPPTAGNVGLALRGVTAVPDPADPAPTSVLDGVYDAADPRAYPLSGYSYLIVPTATDTRFTQDKGFTLARFGQYALCPGQRLMPQLGYAPLPANLVTIGLDRLGQVPGADSTTLTLAGCANPALTADGSSSLEATVPLPKACQRQGPQQCGTSAQVPAFPSDQTIGTNVVPGLLTITADSTPVDLGDLHLDPGNTRLLSTAGVSLNPVTVTDTRAGQLGYTVSAALSGDFVSGPDVIDGENLGWAPAFAAPQPASVNVSLGAPVAPGDALAPGTVTGAGLRTPRVLASSVYDPATGRGGVGTVVVTAALSLRAPTTTRAGRYAAVLVVTAF